MKWRPRRNDAYRLSPFGGSLPSYTPQDPLSRDGTVGPSNQSPIKKMPYRLATVKSDVGIISTVVLLPR